MATADRDRPQTERKPEPSALDAEGVMRIAKCLVEQYGDEAATIALDRADALFDLGNMAGSRGWIRILEVIENQQRASPRAS